MSLPLRLERQTGWRMRNTLGLQGIGYGSRTRNKRKKVQPFLSIKGQDALLIIDFVVYCVFALGDMMSLPQQYSRSTYRYTCIHCCAVVDHQIKLSNTTHCWQKHFESGRVDFSFH